MKNSIILIILMIIMGTTIKTDAIKYFSKDQLSASDSLGHQQVQLLNRDWNEFNISDISWSTEDNIVSVTFDPVLFFQVGDKVRLVQGGVVKYFYVIKIDSDHVHITGGSDYTFDNSDLTYFATSRLANPYGHPIVFNYSSTLQGGDGITVNNQGTFYGTFAIFGTVCTLQAKRTAVASMLSGSGSIIYDDLPVTPKIGGSGGLAYTWPIDLTHLTTTGHFASIANQDSRVSMYTDSGFSAGSVNYTYFVTYPFEQL